MPPATVQVPALPTQGAKTPGLVARVKSSENTTPVARPASVTVATAEVLTPSPVVYVKLSAPLKLVAGV